RVLAITTAGSEGINLFGLGGIDSSRILFVEREWNYAAEEQVEGRLHRIGQRNAVEAYYLVARRTVDEEMARLIDSKRRDFRDVASAQEVQTSVISDLLNALRSGS
ncbi:MAG: hypothetical protein ACOY58_04535, partial [Candidatus Micrarchaeota archaeon]